jgi:hypothetical protein
MVMVMGCGGGGVGLGLGLALRSLMIVDIGEKKSRYGERMQRARAR